MEINEKQKRVFVFIDTNLLWNDKKNFNIFNTFFLKQMIILRDFFLQEVKTTEIRIVIPQPTICERYKQKYDLIKIDIDSALATLNNLKEIMQFNNYDAINQLETFRERLSLIIKAKGDEFLEINKIYSTPECPNEYFEKIIKKAYEKEKPFDSKKVDGFKDALIWYSIINYLKDEYVEKDDLIFLFTQNKRDFASEKTLVEFKTLVQNDLHIIDFKRPVQICHSESREFLKYVLKEAQNTKITNIKIEYSESEELLIIENIFADPFPSNLVSLIDKTRIRRIDCKNFLKKQIIDLLRNFDFNVDLEKIMYNYKKLPNICKIMVFLDFHEEGYYYDINSIEIMFEDGDIFESDYENIIIPDLCIFQHSCPDFDFFKIDSEYNEYIAKMISKQINRNFDPDILSYTITM